MSPEQHEPRTYRGRTIEEVLPRIKAELGPDALITRQRSGLTGGVGGFFQRQCVEVEARPAQALFDAYDEPSAGAEGSGSERAADAEAVEDFVPGLDVADASTREGLGARAIQTMLEQAAPFADQLRDAESSAPREAHPLVAAYELAPAARPEPPAARPEPPGGSPVPPPARPEPPAARPEPPPARPEPPPARPEPPPARPEPPAARPEPPPAETKAPPQAEALATRLIAAGIDATLARTLVGDTVSHALPFGSQRGLKRLVRAALARHIPIAPPPSGRSHAIALIGPPGSGKTLAAARLAAAYAGGSDLSVACVAYRDAGGDLRTLLEPVGVPLLVAAGAAQAAVHVEAERDGAIVVLDGHPLHPRSRDAVERLGDELSVIPVDEIHLTLPATFSAAAARDAIAAGRDAGATRAVVTHADEATDAGAVVAALIEASLPVSYVCEESVLRPAEAAALAAKVLP